MNTRIEQPQQGTPVDVGALMRTVERLQVANKLLQRDLMVADHERRRAEDKLKQLQAGRTEVVEPADIGHGEESEKALAATRRMLSAVFSTIPTLPQVPDEAE